MFFKLLTLEWKSFFRSASFGRGVGVKLLLGFMAIYFFIAFLGLGLGLYFVLEKQFSTQEPIVLVNSFLLFWFLGELSIRFVLQNLPLMEIKPFLTLRLERKKIINSLLWKSFFSFFNLMTLTVALPFVIINLEKTDYGFLSLFCWLIAVLSFVFFLNYLNLLLQRRYVMKIKSLIPYLIVLLVLFAMEYFGFFSISNFFGQFYSLVLIYPFLCLVPLFLAVLTCKLVFNDLKRNLYLDSYLVSKEKSLEGADLGWVDKFGVLAPFIQLDLRLILRNKRAKNTVLMSFFFLFYGLIFYTNKTFDSSTMFVFVGIFMTGIFIINFGQFIPSWDSSYFSLFRTQPISMKNYITAKVLLMYFSVFILTALSTFYAYYGWDKVYLNVACAVYNLGVNIPVILLFSAFNKKRIDLAQGSMFNYQGIGITQWLISIPLFGLPLIVWSAVGVWTDDSTANLVLIGMGVFGLLLHKVVINVVAGFYAERRYLMTEGFKQKD